VRACAAKNPKESQLRLRPEIVTALRTVLPVAPQPGQLAFPTVPRVRTFRNDLERAGIAFEDNDGRRVDFHALRDTFGTHLAAAGVAPFVLKELMRHSTVQQSEKYYIDARHLPLAAAVASLPTFSVASAPRDGQGRAAAVN
jgi:integrase